MSGDAPAAMNDRGQPRGRIEHRRCMTFSTARDVLLSTDRRSQPPEHRPGRWPGRSHCRRRPAACRHQRWL